jgi:hypothetical protein
MEKRLGWEEEGCRRSSKKQRIEWIILVNFAHTIVVQRCGAKTQQLEG